MKLKKSKNKNAGGSIICDKVAQIYDWLDENIKNLDPTCSACGKCCNFDSFGHKLFVTTPELLYFHTNIKENQSLAAAGTAAQSRDSNGAVCLQICPYLKNKKCTARNFRFAGCRIFFCKADADLLSKLSEQTIEKFKALCNEFDFPYRYVDLATALNSPELLKLIER
jgi:Fe-S-cluster containining protein